MKTLKFRPLRIIKKTGKITVASYMQWRKVKTADYDYFTLVISHEYKQFSKDEYVYGHNGEQLFWFNHNNPELLPKNYCNVDEMCKVLQIDREQFIGEEWKFSKEPVTEGFHWSVKGFDCDGIPVFSHYTANYCATHYDNMQQFEPLTVGLVVKWFGWLLYKLQNNKLIFQKTNP